MSDTEKGNSKHLVSVQHIAPAEVETVLKGLSNPIALSLHKGLLHIEECNKHRISYKDLAGEEVLNPQNITVAQSKVVLCKLGVEKSEYRCLKSMSFKLCNRIYCEV